MGKRENTQFWCEFSAVDCGFSAAGLRVFRNLGVGEPMAPVRVMDTPTLHTMDGVSGVRVVVADDHTAVRAGTRALLADAGFNVIADAATLTDTRTTVSRLHPDLLVLDLQLGDDFSPPAIPDLLAASPGLQILMLTMHDEIPLVRACLDAGATGYLLKHAPSEQLIAAATAVARGQAYVEPSLGARLARRPAPNPAAPAAVLPERTRRALLLWAQGGRNADIAAALGVSTRTIDTLRADIRATLGLATRADIVDYVNTHLARHSTDDGEPLTTGR